MHFYPNERIALFADGGNLHATAEAKCDLAPKADIDLSATKFCRIAPRLRRWIGLYLDRQRTVRIVFQHLVLSAKRIAIDLVRHKEMLRVIKRERPEPTSRGGVWSFAKVTV